MPRSRAPSVSAASTRSRRVLATVTRDHQDDLKHAADEDDEQLLHLADAGPQDQQRNEGGRGQIARERYERFEERFDRLVGAHQDAERHRDHRRDHEAADHTPDGHADVEGKIVLDEKIPAVPHHRDRIGEEGPRHVAAMGRERPGRDEQNEERDAQQNAGSVRYRCEGAHHFRTRVPGAAQHVSGALQTRDPCAISKKNGPRISDAALHAASRPGHESITARNADRRASTDPGSS